MSICKISNLFNLIYRYDANTYEMINTLSGHTNHIRDLQWKNNDLGLVTSCSGGYLTFWDSSTGNTNVQFYGKNKSIKTTCLFYDYIYDFTLVACEDQKLRVYTDKGA